MGHGISICCPHCGKYEQNVSFGIGFLFFGLKQAPSINPICWNIVKSKKILNVVNDLMINKKGRLVLEEIDEDGDSICAYGLRAYYSNTEEKLYNLLYFKIEYIENGEIKIYEPVYKDKNKEPLELLDEDDIFDVKIKCPKCGENINEISDEDGMFNAPMINMYNWD